MDNNIIAKNSTIWNSTTKYIVAIGMILFGILLIYLSRNVLTLLISSALLAFVASPVMKFLQRKFKLSRGWSVILTYLFTAIILLTVPFALASQGVRVINFFSGLNFIDIIENTFQWIEDALASLKLLYIPILDPIIDNALESMIHTLENIQTPDPSLSNTPELETVFQSILSAFIASYGFIVDLAGYVISGALAFVFLIMTSIYFSIDGENFYNAFLNNIPPDYKPEISALSTRIRRVWEGFFRGQVTLMIIIGSVVWLGGSAIGLPFALVLGVVAGLLEIIPNLGPTLATIPAVIIALVLGPTYYELNHFVFSLIVIGFYVLVQVFENSFVVPNIMGEAVDLHPILVLTGVFVGASVWGILGALIAAPVIATLKEIFEYFYYKIAWEEPTSTYEPPPEEKKGLLDQVKSFFKRFRREKKTLPADPEVSVQELANPAIETPAKKQATKKAPVQSEIRELPGANKTEPRALTQSSSSIESELKEASIKDTTIDDRTTLIAILLLSIAGFLGGLILLIRPKESAD
jgi:predicted PurR-regulated permease PerM